ncbi:MAG: ubiquinol-cytochrome c reductase iron-sulfur subunit [Anaerolineales bacterium]|nr:ubiquinol-cytochrome c reductase iron-sulfur subunit [Anaerolineales bacterium]
MRTKYKSPNLDRRSFVKIVTTFLGSIMAAIVGLPMIQYFISPALNITAEDDWISLGSLENYPMEVPTKFTFTLTRINGWEKSSQSYGAFVFRQSEKDVIVFSDVCTHLSCRVAWDAENAEYFCPCHAALFDINGEVISGPPPRPLDQYEIKLEEDQLFIHLQEG